jgi:hypothetical protein
MVGHPIVELDRVLPPQRHVSGGLKGYLFFAAIFFFARDADCFAAIFFVALFFAVFAADFFLAFFAVVAPPGFTTAISFVPIGVPRPVQASQPGPA